MTIRPGEPWGVSVDRPPDLRLATSDAELASLLTDGTGIPTAVTSGDIARTLGNPPVATSKRLTSAPIDLMDVSIDGDTAAVAVAHVVALSPPHRGSWWRGPVVAVMNAEFMGEWDVAPRGHPNDGRAEVFETLPGFGVRQRWACRRRLPNAAHVPHPLIRTRSVRTATWTFERSVDVRVDGVRLGASRTLEVTVRPDAAFIQM